MVHAMLVSALEPRVESITSGVFMPRAAPNFACESEEPPPLNARMPANGRTKSYRFVRSAVKWYSSPTARSYVLPLSEFSEPVNGSVDFVWA